MAMFLALCEQMPIPSAGWTPCSRRWPVAKKRQTPCASICRRPGLESLESLESLEASSTWDSGLRLVQCLGGRPERGWCLGAACLRMSQTLQFDILPLGTPWPLEFEIDHMFGYHQSSGNAFFFALEFEL